MEDVSLTIESGDQDGTRSVQRIEAVKLSATSEFVHDFVVPERLDSLTITLDAKVESLSTQQRLSLSDHKEISINTIDRTDLLSAAHLLRSGDDYSIEILGKNGEPLPARTVQVSFFHRLFEQPQVLKFRSDRDGKVYLGGLAGMSRIHTEIDSMVEIWELEIRDHNHGPMRDYHIGVGETVSVPAPDSGIDLGWENYSLLEMRGGLPVRDWFQALSVDAEGTLKISGLPAGEYRLETSGGGSSKILVSHEGSAEILATTDQFLEHSRSQPVLGLQIQDPADGKLRLRVTNPSKHTRVHAVASHFVPRFAFASTLLDQIDRSPRVASIRRAENAFVSGRSIGDEYRYILERRDRQKFPGNLLPRPGLILNPWALGESSSEALDGKAGSMFFGSEAGRRRSELSGDDGFARAVRDSSYSNLDFLTLQQRSFYNLKPDANGIVELDLEELGSARFIRAVAIDGERLASRSRALPPVRLERRDRRLQKRDQLDPLGRFVQVREMKVIPAGVGLAIDRSNGARFQIYDDLGDAFALLNAIGGDATLEKFSFILRWPKLNPEEKRHQYSDHACHELNLFLARHDPQFFNETIQPYLKNKREKDFLDHYLLGDELGGYLEEWRLVRLNAAERALLARRLEGDAQRRTVQSLIDQYESKPVDYRLRERLFRAALAGNDLSAGDALRSFDNAMGMGDGIAPDESAAGVEYVRRQLKSIIIPEIDFSEATIEEAVEFLRRQAQFLDPESGGVNIVVKHADGTSPDDASTPINLQLTNVPLEDALKFTTELAGLKFRIDNGVIVIVPGYEEGGSLITQVYRVAPDFLQLDGGRPAAPGSCSAASASHSQTEPPRRSCLPRQSWWFATRLRTTI